MSDLWHKNCLSASVCLFFFYVKRPCWYNSHNICHYIQSHMTHTLAIIDNLATGFDPGYESSSGHYIRIWMYTETNIFNVKMGDFQLMVCSFCIHSCSFILA